MFTDDNMTLKGAFLRILNNVFGSWKWWENVETRPI